MQSLASDIQRLGAKLPFLAILPEMISTVLSIRQLDQEMWGSLKQGEINIGLLGEIFTINDPATNLNLVQRLKRLGAHVDNTITLSHFIFAFPASWGLMPSPFVDNEVWAKAKVKSQALFPKAIGGHGNDSITSLIYYHSLGYDGAVHILPFPCMPEATVAQHLDLLAEYLNFPLLRLVFDEHSGDAGLDTRLEAFVDMLNFRKNRLPSGVGVDVARS